MNQDEIDDLLLDDLCPACLSDVNVTNELLLNINCTWCSCTFNSTLEVDLLDNTNENNKESKDLF